LQNWRWGPKRDIVDSGACKSAIMGLEGRKLRSVERGSALSRRHRCGFCHNPDFSGHDQIPRIAVQREHYLVKARRIPDQERRGYDPSMVDIARQLGDAEILDLPLLPGELALTEGSES
jgi:cytochrome c553